MIEASPLGIYVHVPFCRSKCPYCDFCSHPPAPGEMDRYVAAAVTEMALRATDRPIQSLYFGGGTPSYLSMELLRDLLDGANKSFRLMTDCEITVEANPLDATSEWLVPAKNSGINRLSLGVQGVREEDLRLLGRRHSLAQAVEAVKDARDAGFDNLGIDIIYGLPGHTPEIVRGILTEAVELFAPDHISCYQLTIADGTPLHESVQRGDLTMPDNDTESAIFMTTHETLADMGYEGYEVSNFARGSAYRSRHNSAYWTHTDYVGIGPAAHSLMKPVRSWNMESTDAYCKTLEHGELATDGTELLTAIDLASETIMLGLRTSDGIDTDALRDVYGVDLMEERASDMEKLMDAGLLIFHAPRLRPTLKGMALADQLAVELAPDS